MIRRPPRSTPLYSSAASDVYKRQALLHEKNIHIVASALDIILATAAAGEEEALITGGVIDHLDQIQGHRDPLIQKKVQEALWLLVPEVEEVVTSKPQDDY